MKNIFYFFLILIFSTNLIAIEHNNGLWFGTMGTKKINQNFSFWGETQLRYDFDTGAMNQILYRTGLLHHLEQDFSLGYLYGYIQSSSQKEHRPTFQATMSWGDFKNLFLTHRHRLELRFIEDNNEDSYRYRYLVKATQKTSSFYKLIAWNEVFINLNKTQWNGQRTFERNRLFVGTKLNFESIDVEVGYLNQFIPRSQSDTSEHLFTTYIMF